MGKQLYFAHTEDDIYQLLNFLDKLYAKIIINGVLYAPSEMYTQVLFEMSAYRNPQYSLVFVPDVSYIKSSKEARVADGTAIEVMNCWKWSCESHTYYDKGRIYLSKTKVGEYDVHALAMYNKLCSYFKKNYVFCKQLGIYFSRKFKSENDLKQVFLSQLGHPIDLQ